MLGIILISLVIGFISGAWAALWICDGDDPPYEDQFRSFP